MTHSDMRRSAFTLLEILMVVAIIAVVLAVVLPRTGRGPRRLAVETTLSRLRTAARDAGMRARAGGSEARLALHPDSGLLRVEGGREASEGADVDERAADVVTYQLSDAVTWDADNPHMEEGDRWVFRFFPDGEAAGPELVFAMWGRDFRFRVDRLSGRPEVAELED